MDDTPLNTIQVEKLTPIVKKTTYVVAMSALLNPLNSSMISVALLSIAAHYHINIAQTSWLILGYFLMTAIGQPVMGSLTDLLGHRRIFSIGLAFVALFSLLSFWAPSFGWLFALRILLALSNTSSFPAGMAMLQASTRASGTKNGRIPASSMGIISVAKDVTAALGPVIGGFLVSLGGWRAIFWINVPIALTILLMFYLWIPKGVDIATRRQVSVWKLLDLPGMLLFSGILTGLMFFLMSLTGRPLWWLLFIVLPASYALLRYELRRENPFLNMRMLGSNLKLVTVFLQYAGLSIVYFCILFGVPLWLEKLRGFEPKVSGLVMLPLLGFGVVATKVAVQIIFRYTFKRSIIIGHLFLVLGTFLLLFIQSDSSLVLLLFILAILGVPNGLINVGLQTALFTHVKQEETGIASGMFLTFRALGSILSTILIGIVFSEKVTMSGLHSVAIIAFAISIAMMLGGFSRRLM